MFRLAFQQAPQDLPRALEVPPVRVDSRQIHVERVEIGHLLDSVAQRSNGITYLPGLEIQDREIVNRFGVITLVFDGLLK